MRETSSVTHLPEPRERYGSLMNYVDGEWVESKGETKPVDNPAKNTIIAEVSMSTRDALETAVQAARAAFAEWRETAPHLAGARLLAEVFAALAKAHQARGRLLAGGHPPAEAEREMILEPVSGLEREAYLPYVEACDSAEECVQKGTCLEELAARLYRDISQSAVEFSREAARIRQPIAGENNNLRNRTAETWEAWAWAPSR